MTQPPTPRPRRDAPEPAGHPVGRFHIQRDGFLYAGRFDGAVTQRPAASVLLSLNELPFDVFTEHGDTRSVAAFIAPGVRKRIHAPSGSVACIDVSPSHRAYPALARSGGSVRAWTLAHFQDHVDALRQFRRGVLGLAASDLLYANLVALAGQCVPAVAPVDARVRQVMKRLRAGPADMFELARSVHLSKDWLAHLFMREVGLPLRRYEQSLKLQAAAAHLHLGLSLTEVAANAGFADSAHLSKLWKQHYGFPPQRIFTGEEVAIDPLPRPSCLGLPADVATDPATRPRSVSR